MSSIAGGPAPVAATPPPATGTAGAASRADARMASVAAASMAKEQDPLPKRDAAYGLRAPVTSHEASARYDTRGKVSQEPQRKPGDNVDVKV